MDILAFTLICDKPDRRRKAGKAVGIDVFPPEVGPHLALWNRKEKDASSKVENSAAQGERCS